MWVLYNTENQPVYYLAEKRQYSVGRKKGECDLLLENDKSISRKHTLMTVLDNGSIEFEDFSKYGTEMNSNKLPVKKKIVMTSNDEIIIKFGIDKSDKHLFHVKYEKIVFVCEDHLSSKLKTMCGDRDISVETDATKQRTFRSYYVHENNTNVTNKLLLALIANYQVVNVDFVQQMCKLFEQQINTNQQLPIPDPATYRPKLAGVKQSAANKINFSVESRVNPLKSASFLFFEQELQDKWSMLLNAAGANTFLWSNFSVDIDNLESFFSKHARSVLLSPEATDIVRKNQQFFNVLSELKFELVPSQNIEIAILTCSDSAVFPMVFPPDDIFTKYKRAYLYRLEQERLEKERIENERREKERLERERLEKERLEKERLERERIEKERLEKERKERIERERLENERIQKEKEEQERLRAEELRQSSVVIKKEKMDSQIPAESNQMTDEEPTTKVISRKGTKRTRNTQRSSQAEESVAKKVKTEESLQQEPQEQKPKECYISVEFVDLVVKSEDIKPKLESSYSGSSTMYNAKKFRKAKVGFEAYSQTSSQTRGTPEKSSIIPIATSADISESQSVQSTFFIPNSNISDKTGSPSASQQSIRRNSSQSEKNTSVQTTPEKVQLPVATYEVEDDGDQDEEYQQRLQKIFAEKAGSDDEDDDDDKPLDLLMDDFDTAKKKKRKK